MQLNLSREFTEKTGQIHVDMKPSNFCASASGRGIFLIDFGYSTFPHVQLPGQTGTPLFMSRTIQTIGTVGMIGLTQLHAGKMILSQLHTSSCFLLPAGRRAFLGVLIKHIPKFLPKNQTPKFYNFAKTLQIPNTMH